MLISGKQKLTIIKGISNKSGGIEKSWNGVNSILSRNLPTTEINRIDVGDNSCTTPLEISNALNYHFTHIGPRLVDNIFKTSVCFEDYSTPTDSSFTLNETHCVFVHCVVSSLRVDKATGVDGISARFLKEACPGIVPSLTHIINLSISCGYFPDEWKISKVLPLYKEDLKSDPNNYRPISLLPFVSKIIEKVIFKQLYEYLTHNNLLAGSQHGFRPMHSTLTTLHEATNNWCLNIDDGLINSVLFLDPKKALTTAYC